MAERRPVPGDVIHLRGRSSDVIVDVGGGVPEIVHWGAPLSGPLDPGLVVRPLVPGAADVEAGISIVPEHGAGFTGRPGLLGHRPGGRAWAPQFTTDSHDVEHHDGRARLVVRSRDVQAALALTVVLELEHTLVVRAEVTNLGADEYALQALTVTLPIPQHASELGLFTGRWAREMQLTRLDWRHGSHSVENRSGRTSHAHPPLLFAGSPAYGEWSGSVWGAHLAWSGNHAMLAARLPDGRRLVQIGELLHPGEVLLAPGESYRTPEVVAVHSDAGLTSATQQFHRHLRSRTTHPVKPRPVVVNTWEAVYFDHDMTVLRALADRAAALGAERFVLDDGWFGGRRHDRAGLGDWVVSADVYPDGLKPLIDHVRGLGMDFGLWVEPEMVNPDSDLYRAHPEWALVTDGYEPVTSRHQLVLDLTNPDAYRHVFQRLDDLLCGLDIASLKWDMNRDHVAGSRSNGAAGSHHQTLAVYRLIDELLQRHPTVEIESCSSGGGRIDFEILRRTTRVWASDSNDPLERQTIQRGMSMLIPPELIGAHIGDARSHTTGRRHTLEFRAATAIFGQLGIEADLTTMGADDLDDLQHAVAVHRAHRPLLHSGDVVRFDTEPPYVAHGVYAPDLSQALVSFAAIATAPSLTPPPLRLPGLDPDRQYRVERLALSRRPEQQPGRTQPLWCRPGGITATGAQLAVVGLQPPAINPETAVLIRITS